MPIKIYQNNIYIYIYIVNVDNNEENVYEKIILLDAKHDDNIVLMELISEDNEKILLF